MATDYLLMVRNLLSFHDLHDQTVLAVGAGGGLFVGYAGPTRKVTAVDHDGAALESLRVAAGASGMAAKFEYLEGDFMKMELPSSADVTLFDFCLHEIADPAAALSRAGRLTRKVIVFDHGRASERTYYVAEEDKVRASWEAVAKFPVSCRREYSAQQRFSNHAELLARTAGQGELAVQRARRFEGEADITIPMTYELALIEFTA